VVDLFVARFGENSLHQGITTFRAVVPMGEKKKRRRTPGHTKRKNRQPSFGSLQWAAADAEQPTQLAQADCHRQ
jgi:hypothetical protein